ncbi:hypothetical protein KIPB_002242 [Kipferlia bialata]|uniref:Uncharacterized protein n=1 Tax=Kipferlia bialata TaxID=797122 RepID=A0A9K3GG32_9EUKA|nr:hypothetical protein KIPB_002242 [Kipferlia bialata]|eukprot:g2242.t1
MGKDFETVQRIQRQMYAGEMIEDLSKADRHALFSQFYKVMEHLWEGRGPVFTHYQREACDEVLELEKSEDFVLRDATNIYAESGVFEAIVNF